MERISNLSKLNLIILSFVITLNTFTFFDTSHGIEYLLIYVIPYIVCCVLILLFKKQSFNTLLLTALACYVALTGDKGNFSGSIFLIFAIEIDKGRNKTIIKWMLLVIAIALKSLFHEITPIQTINLLVIHGVVYVYYLIVFSEKKNNPVLVNDQEKQILDMHLKDSIEIKEIADRICLETGTVNKIIRRLIIKNKCKNKAQFFVLLGQRYYKIDK